MTVKVLLHEFRMGDVDDPALYAAAPLHEWEQSIAGQWAMKNSITTPVWTMQHDQFSYQAVVRIHGEFSDMDATVYRLKCFDQ